MFCAQINHKLYLFYLLLVATPRSQTLNVKLGHPCCSQSTKTQTSAVPPYTHTYPNPNITNLETNRNVPTKKLPVFPVQRNETRLTKRSTKAAKISRRFLISRLVREMKQWRPWTSFAHGHLARRDANFQGSRQRFWEESVSASSRFPI